MSAKEVHEQTVCGPPATERLKLAALILNGLQSHSIIDFRDEWSDEDLREAALHSFERAGESFEEDRNA